MLLEQCARHAQQALLDLVVVADHAATEHLGGSRDVGEAAGQQAARATFRDRKRLVEAPQLLENQAGDVGAAVAEKGLPEALAAGLAQGTQARLVEPVRNGGQAHVDIGEVGAVGDAHPAGRLVQQGREQVGDPAFAQADGAQLHGGRGRDGPLEGLQARQHLILEHGDQLARRTGQQDDDLIPQRDPLARRGAIRVWQRLRPLDQVALLEIVGRRLAAARGEEGADGGLDRRAVHQLAPEGGGHAGGGVVVAGGAEAAGHQQQIGPPEGALERFHQLFRLVTQLPGPADGQAVVVQFAAQVDQVAVRAQAVEQLVADRHQLDFAARGHRRGRRAGRLVLWLGLRMVTTG